MINTTRDGSCRFLSRDRAILGLAVAASAAVLIFMAPGATGAEPVFSVGPDGSLRMGQPVPMVPKVGDVSVSGDQTIDEQLQTFRAAFLRGDIADAMITARSISDRLWYKTHKAEFTVSATGGLIAEPNGRRFVDDGGCVNSFSRITTFITHDAHGNQYSVMPAHAINPALTQYRYLKFADAAVKPLQPIKARECFAVSDTPSQSQFKIGVTVGGEQLAGVIFPLKPMIDTGLIQFELQDLQAKYSHLEVGRMLTADDVVCIILPSNIDKDQLVLKGIYGGSGRPLVSTENGTVEVVGTQMNVTPVTFSKGDPAMHMLCYSSASHIKSLMEIGPTASPK